MLLSLLKSSLPDSEEGDISSTMSCKPVIPENVQMNTPDASIFSRIQELTENSARIQLMYEELERNNCFPQEIEKVQKSALISQEFRKKGNAFYVKRQYTEALDSYQNAIVTAPKDSSELALGYGNRSAIFFELGFHEHSLLDISRALEAGYDELLKPKLLKRRTICEKALPQGSNNIEDGRKILLEKLTNRNSNIPCASADINISYDSRFGRCIIATQDIPPGTILAIEEPYSAILTDFKTITGCYGCCKPNNVLIPCETCSIAMFCDEECRSRTWDQYHKYECFLMDFINNWELDDEHWLAFRIMLKARHDHESWDDFIKTIQGAERQTEPLLKGLVAADSSESTMQIYDSTRYTPIHVLESNITKLNAREIGTKATGVAILLNQLKTSTTFFSDHFELNEENMNSIMYSVGGLILHLSLIMSTNAENIYHKYWNRDLASNPYKLLPHNYALGLYPFLSLINHSCCPNVEILSVLTTKLALTVSPIKKGQQIFKNYSCVYWTSEYEKRLQDLRKIYRFKCECEACINRWPLFANLPDGDFPSRDRFNEYRDVYIQMISQPNEAASIETLNELCKDLELSSQNRPTKMLIRLKALLVASWDMFGNNSFCVTKFYSDFYDGIDE